MVSKPILTFVSVEEEIIRSIRLTSNEMFNIKNLNLVMVGLFSLNKF